MTTPMSPWFTITSPGLTLTSINGIPARSRGHVLASALAGLSLRADDFLSVAPVAPPSALATALELPPRPYAPPSLAQGASVLRAIRDALESTATDKKRLAKLRRLAAWVTLVFFRYPAVVTFLDTQSEPTRGGFFKMAKSKGAPAQHARLLGVLLAVEAVVRTQDEPTVSAACAVVAKTCKLPAGPDHLENEFSRYGELVTAIAAGYAVPAVCLNEYQWPMRADDEMTFYGLDEGESGGAGRRAVTHRRA